MCCEIFLFSREAEDFFCRLPWVFLDWWCDEHLVFRVCGRYSAGGLRFGGFWVVGKFWGVLAMDRHGCGIRRARVGH